MNIFENMYKDKENDYQAQRPFNIEESSALG